MDKINKRESEETSVKDLLLKYRNVVKYLKSQWITLIICGFLGSVLGFIYAAFIKKATYTAVSTFVLEDSKSSSLSQYAGLASLAGIDINSSSSGIFSGDNIIELYKSRTMIEKALLRPIVVNGNKQLLIDRYIDALDLRAQWKKKNNVDHIDFNAPLENFNRQQDSIIQEIVAVINKKILSVSKPDKKLTIIEVDVTFPDEIFAQKFNDELVATVNDFYIKTKTKVALQNVTVLQKLADSTKQVLNSSIGGVASAIDATPNANPLQTSLRVASQKKQIDVQSSGAMYAEMVKNLELAKISLRQEMPLIQVIDTPILPLAVDKLSKGRAIISGFLIGAFFSALFLVLKRFVKSLIN